MATYGKKASDKVEAAMHERKHGTLKSGGSGKKVTSRKQAIAIGLSEARKEGGKVPAKKGAAKRSAKKTAAKKSRPERAAPRRARPRRAPPRRAGRPGRRRRRRRASRRRSARRPRRTAAATRSGGPETRCERGVRPFRSPLRQRDARARCGRGGSHLHPVARQQPARLDLGPARLRRPGVLPVRRGPRPRIADLRGRLERDPRHRAMRILQFGRAKERRFASWRLGYAYSADPAAIARLGAGSDADAVAAFERWVPGLSPTDEGL